MANKLEAGLALDVVTDDEKRHATGGVAVARRAAVLSKDDRNIMLGELMVDNKNKQWLFVCCCLSLATEKRKARARI